MKRFTMTAAVLAVLTALPAAAQEYTADEIAHGKDLYMRECSVCHGAEGEGDGPGARYLSQRPRNLTLGVFKIRSTPSGEYPLASDIFETLTHGLAGSHGAQMPAFSALSEEDRWALVAAVRDFAGMDVEGAEVPIPARQGAHDPELGRQVYEQLKCAACHGAEGYGDGESSLTLKDDDRRRIFAASLRDGRYKGGDAPAELWMRFYTGLDGSPMPAYAGKATDEELWALTDYVLGLREEAAK